MNKILIIIQREYLTRVKKKTFIFMTILGPLLMAALMITPYMIARSDDKVKIVDVVDESGIYYNNLGSNKTIVFNYLNVDVKQAKKQFNDETTYALLYIPRPAYKKPVHAILLYDESKPSITVTTYIQERMKYVLENKTLKDLYNIDKEDINSVKTNINLIQQNIDTGENNYPVLTSIFGYVGGFLIYLFIFLFGSQVMRGVIEEKTSRIVEVIVSSVKPFQLMMGKIIGLALVGLTQFALWIVLTVSIVSVFQASFIDKSILKNNNQQEWVLDKNVVIPDEAQLQNSDQNMELSGIMSTLQGYDFTAIILSFLFFFLFGYLMYASLFAAIGSAVDNEADTQQFMLPITIPLVFAFLMGMNIIENPNGELAFWLSIIPLTSPVIMMIRLPFGVPYFDYFLSMFLLILAFIGTTWMAGKIYRTGILMYGKKVSYRELWKWLTYSN